LKIWPFWLFASTKFLPWNKSVRSSHQERLKFPLRTLNDMYWCSACGFKGYSRLAYACSACMLDRTTNIRLILNRTRTFELRLANVSQLADQFNLSFSTYDLCPIQEGNWKIYGECFITPKGRSLTRYYTTSTAVNRTSPCRSESWLSAPGAGQKNSRGWGCRAVALPIRVVVL
jgi:hypothetical protein